MVFASGLALLIGSAYFEWCAEPSASPIASIEMAYADEMACDDEGFSAVDWEYWQSVNPDVIGWVNVPDTAIDFPIVQAHRDNPTFYLTHDVYGGWNYLGCPYLDAECESEGFDSRCALIYGHNAGDGKMFADFAKYNVQSYADSHSTILLQTPSTKYKLQVSAVDIVKGKSVVNETLPSPVVGFCTCSYNYWPKDERTIVYATVESAMRN